MSEPPKFIVEQEELSKRHGGICGLHLRTLDEETTRLLELIRMTYADLLSRDFAKVCAAAPKLDKLAYSISLGAELLLEEVTDLPEESSDA